MNWNHNDECMQHAGARYLGPFAMTVSRWPDVVSVSLRYRGLNVPHVWIRINNLVLTDASRVITHMWDVINRKWNMFTYLWYCEFHTVDTSTPAPSSCDELNCYFNATCEVHEGQAKCICHFTCPQDYHSHYQVLFFLFGKLVVRYSPLNVVVTLVSQAVCGNDGQTYSSECQLKLYSCRYQKDIAVQALSSCTGKNDDQ